MLYRQIQFSKSFIKQFKPLTDRQKDKFYERLQIFTNNPHDRILRDHALKGKYSGYRSIDIQGDLRVLYRIEDDRIIIFALIGTHSQLY